MATFTKHQPGDFCWMELGTTDQPAAKTFYGGLFGWTAQDNPMGPSEVYTMYALTGRLTAGAFRVGPGTDMADLAPHWDLYVAVASADETVRKAVETGGKILKGPFDVYVFGRMAVIEDPTGAIFCIWEPKQHQGIGVKDEEGAFCWADLSTPDPAKAKDFYEKVFGWTIEGGHGENADYLHIKNAGEYIGGIRSQEHRNSNTPAHWLLYFQTADCNARLKKAAELGARTILPPLMMPKVGTVAILADPKGAVFALYQSSNGG